MQAYSQPLNNGFFETLVIADPAVGADFSQLMPNNFTYELLGVLYTLATSVTVINRFHRIQILDAGVILISPTGLNAQTASVNSTASFFQGANDATSGITTQYTAPLPIRLNFPGNLTVRSQIINLQVGDQISGIILTYRKWVDQTV